MAYLASYVSELAMLPSRPREVGFYRIGLGLLTLLAAFEKFHIAAILLIYRSIVHQYCTVRNFIPV
jgi:hypothetical protein